MNIGVRALVLEAIQEALRVAQVSAEKQLPISNVDAEALCNRFFTEKEEKRSYKTDSNLNWVLAFIECEGDLEESAEFQEVVRLLKDGYLVGGDHSESGAYCFEVDQS